MRLQCTLRPLGAATQELKMKGGWGAVLARAKWVIRVVRHRRWAVMACAWGVSVLSALAIQLVPERYEGAARIYVDTQTVLKPMMVGLTYQPDIDQQVRILARTLISRPNVGRLLDRPDMGFATELARNREALVSRLMEQIKIVAGERGNLYTISYRDANPERARRVVEGMVSLFVNSGADSKKRDSEDAGKFVEVQAQAMEQKLIEAEGRLKDFKVRNFGLTGVSNQDYFSRISALSDEVAKLQSDLAAAEKARDAYRHELASEDPNLPDDAAPGQAAGGVSPLDARLDAQRKQLDDLLLRYTDQHPDVLGARRLVADLERQQRQARQAKAADRSGRPPGLAATSPVFQKLRVALAESEAQVASMRSKLTALQDRLAQTRGHADRIPQVEAELAQLTRDYDVMRKSYDQLVARRESASLGVKLDESSQLAEFRVIEPPRVSPSAVFPAHLHLALMAALLSVATGVAVAMAMDVASPTLNDALALEKLTGRPVLGAVSLTLSQDHQLARRLRMRQFLAALGLLVLFQVAWVAWVALTSLKL
jgi:polysaccharide chain length determinant protein (PEP-CTERM system associated)